MINRYYILTDNHYHRYIIILRHTFFFKFSSSQCTVAMDLSHRNVCWPSLILGQEIYCWHEIIPSYKGILMVSKGMSISTEAPGGINIFISLYVK